MVTRLLWLAVFILGLVTAWCSQLGDTGQRMAAHQMSLVTDCPGAAPPANSVAVQEAKLALDASLKMTSATLWIGLAIVILAGTGLSRKDGAPKG